MIYYFKPFSSEKNLGKAYNHYMSLLPNDSDWGCLLDGDTMFLTPNYGNQLEIIINKYPNTGIFTCVTNRVGNLEQCYQNKISENSDILYHKQIADKLQKENFDKVKVLNKIISGHLMLIQKKTWNNIQFDEIPNKLLSIDNHFSYNILKSNKEILLMEGVYLFHYYRFLQGVKDKSHLL